MRKFILYLASFLAAGGLLISPQPVLAQPVEMPNSEITSIIRKNCSSLKVTIKQIHTNDALARVSIGQKYNAVSTKLMARFNSRLSLNKLDSSGLVRITSDFETQRLKFNSDYNKYDTAMANLDKASCKTDQAKFYEKIIEARDARNYLSDSVKSMNGLLAQYKSEVRLIKDSLSGGGNE